MDQYPTTESGRREKARVNRAMFDGIARRYDLLNRVMSLGLDARWRRRQVDLCAVGPGSRCLDVCCGTGDVARALARRGAATVGLDASAGMLAVARERVGEEIALVRGDALRMPFPDDTFDALTIAFGNRNVASLSGLFTEMRRVAKPGGRIVSLEINRPAAPWLQWAFLVYFSRLPALFARLLGSDPSAYEYLPESVKCYPNPAAVAEIMREAGLHDVCVLPSFGGVVVIHVGIA
ncbi:MAG: ubiquinone/menaquinone biosynthesis methyltransferase [Armatimonadota bacterium]